MRKVVLRGSDPSDGFAVGGASARARSSNVTVIEDATLDLRKFRRLQPMPGPVSAAVGVCFVMVPTPNCLGKPSPGISLERLSTVGSSYGAREKSRRLRFGGEQDDRQTEDGRLAR